MTKFFHVGANPRWTLLIRVCGENTRIPPTTTSSSWVEKSVNARMMLSRAASLTPTTLIADSTTITPIPKMTSPGEVFSAGQNSPPM